LVKKRLIIVFLLLISFSAVADNAVNSINVLSNSKSVITKSSIEVINDEMATRSVDASEKAAQAKKASNLASLPVPIGLIMVIIVVLGFLFHRTGSIIFGILGVYWGAEYSGLVGAIVGGLLGLFFGYWGLLFMGRGGGGFSGFGGGRSGGGGSGRSW
jgi:hypothetical protein